MFNLKYQKKIKPLENTTIWRLGISKLWRCRDVQIEPYMIGNSGRIGKIMKTSINLL
jgi:hypothetical protein